MSTQELATSLSVPSVPLALAARDRDRARVEVPTLLLIFATYGAWLAVTRAYGHWPLIIVAPLVAVILTLHSSLQHECVHGHPTRWERLNRLLAVVPLSLWLPYNHYWRLHRRHHNDTRLTDPLDDPESFYWNREQWERLTPLVRWLLKVQQTFAGRLLLGPFWIIGTFLHREWEYVRANRDNTRLIWLEHLAWCVPVIWWVKFVCGIPLWLYALAMILPSYALVLIRSFAEHRARESMRERVAVVEYSWILGPLFLFNNLHSLHHESPQLPWYELPGRYRRERARLLAANGGLVYRTYFDVARRFLFRPHDVLLHPTDGVPAVAD
jgi:fatty acid desaturase